MFEELLPFDVFATDFLFAAAIVGLAGLVRGFSGFGSAMINAPMLSLLWGPTVGVPVASFIEIAPVAQMTVPALKVAHKRTVLALGLPALLFMPLGAWLLVTVPAGEMRRALAVIVLLLVAVLWSGWRYTGRRTVPVTSAIGAVGGVLGGTTGMGGPPVILYLMSGNDGPAVIRANLVLYFTIIFFGLLAVYGAAGLVSIDIVWRTGLLVPLFVVGVFFGSRLFGLASERVFRNLAMVVLTGSACWVLLA